MAKEFEEECREEGGGEGAEGGPEDVAPVGGAVGECELPELEKSGQHPFLQRWAIRGS